MRTAGKRCFHHLRFEHLEDRRVLSTQSPWGLLAAAPISMNRPSSEDLTPPLVSFEINDRATSTNSPLVNLALTASDATSGAAEMRFAINSLAESAFTVWEPFAASKTLALPKWDGTNYVNVQVRDNSGNVGFAWQSIVLDTAAPNVGVQINGGAGRQTNSPTVSVALTTADATSGVAEMRFAINSLAETTFSAWEPAGATKALTLPTWEGVNYVNVQVRDEAGNVGFAWNRILLNLPPTVAQPASATSNPVTGISTKLSVLRRRRRAARLVSCTRGR